MKISILLPYKENFSPIYPGAVSLFLKDTIPLSKFNKEILVYGNTNYKETVNSILGNFDEDDLYGSGFDNKQKNLYTRGDNYSKGPSIKQDNIKGVSNVFSPNIIVNPPVFDMNTGMDMM